MWCYKHFTEQEEQILFDNFSETAVRPSILPEDTSPLYDKVPCSHCNPWSTEKASLQIFPGAGRIAGDYSNPPYLWGTCSKTPRGFLKLWVAPNPKYTMPFSYTYVNMIKLNLSIRHSKRLTVSNNITINALYYKKISSITILVLMGHY